MPSSEISKRLPLFQTGIQWIWLTIAFFVIDQVTKYLAVTYIQPNDSIEVLPFFNLVIRYNPGAAFSFLADAGAWGSYFLTGISAIVSLGIVYWMYTIPAKNKWLSFSLAMILAGALGNLYDRVTLGKVVDFIDWYYGSYHWPAFNIADSVIMIGAVMMLLDGFFNKPEEKTE